MILPFMLFVAAVYGAVDESIDLFEQKWLGDQQLRVLYLPKGGDRFSVAFDVRGLPLYGEESQDWKFIKPVLCFLKDESLRGCFVKNEAHRPEITSADFSLKDEDLAHYDRRPFYSEKLRCFLQCDCPQVCSDSPSRVLFHEGWQNLCGGTLKSMLLWWRTWQWSVEERKDFEEEVKDTDNQTRVFVLAQGGNVMKGTMTMRFFGVRESYDEKSLLDYKLEAVGDEMKKIYAWSLDKRDKCLNKDALH